MGLSMSKEIVMIRSGERTPAADEVVVEAPLTIYVDGREFGTLLCTPEYREALVLGFLSTKGLLTSLDDVTALRLREGGTVAEVELANKCGPGGQCLHRRAGLPECGPGVILSGHPGSLYRRPVGGEGVSFSEGEIHSLMKELQERALLFKATGGAHNAALAANGGIVLFCEDVGRHNAVDKIIGESLRQDIRMEDKALLCSCRLSREILLKAAVARLPLLISRAAPTAAGIELAESLNITLAGFVRDGRMNVYTHPRRVK